MSAQNSGPVSSSQFQNPRSGIVTTHLVGEVVQAVVILIIIPQVGGVDLVMATPMSIVILMAGGVDQVMVQLLFIIMVDMVGDMAPRCTIVMAGVDENRPEIERSTTDLREKMAGVMYVKRGAWSSYILADGICLDLGGVRSGQVCSLVVKHGFGPKFVWGGWHN